MSAPERRCCLCRAKKPLTPLYFERCPNKPAGFNYRCKDCESIWNRINYRQRRIATHHERVEAFKKSFDKKLARMQRQMSEDMKELKKLRWMWGELYRLRPAKKLLEEDEPQPETNPQPGGVARVDWG